MKKIFVLLIAAAMLGSFALAQSLHQGGRTADGDQVITLSIPERVALYIVKDSFNRDIDTWVSQGARLGYDNDGRPTSSECGLVRASQAAGVTSLHALYAATRTNVSTSSYPAYVGSGTTFEGAYVACYNHTNLHLFSNAPRGIELRAAIDMPIAAGQFGLEIANPMADRNIVTGGPEGDLRALVSESANVRIAVTSGSYGGGGAQNGNFTGHPTRTDLTTGGWATANLIQAIYLDGSESAGNKAYTITYTLTGAF